MEGYYRLVESYRNTIGKICHRTILNVGFIEDELTPEQMNQIARTLTQMHERKATLFPQSDPNVTKWVHELWSRIIKDCRLDLTLYDPQNICEIGAEWICYNTWHKLKINKVLEENEFSEKKYD